MPRKDRFNVLQNIYNGLNHGGAFIFAEKTVCEDSRLQEMITFNFYDYKRKHLEQMPRQTIRDSHRKRD